MSRKFTARQAIAYLAQLLEEAITDGEVPLWYLVGGKQCILHQPGLCNLEAALRAAGYDNAADVVAKEIRDE